MKRKKEEEKFYGLLHFLSFHEINAANVLEYLHSSFEGKREKKKKKRKSRKVS